MKVSTTLIRLNVMVRVAFPSNIRKHIATGVTLNARQEWLKGSVINRPDAVDLNAIIGKRVAEVKRAIALLDAQGIAVTPDTITDAMTEDVDMGDFLAFMERRINERPLRESSKEQHRIALDALRRFGRIKSFASLTIDNIMLFDRFLREEDTSRSQTTINYYHARIKPYVSEAVKLRKIRENPYNYFTTKPGASKLRNTLDEDELNIIYNAQLPPPYDKAQDIFIFQAYTGLAYSDAMAFDARHHLITRDGKSFISYKRTKTNAPYYTPMLPRAEAVLMRYGHRLPRLSNQKYNVYLHDIELMLGLNKPLTSHVARHSFATLMLSHDIPIAVVSRMLGHSNISTTQIYAKITDTKIEKVTSHLWAELE